MENQYTVAIETPSSADELYGAWCEELQLSAFGETEAEAFYNLMQNIPLYFEVEKEQLSSSRERGALLTKTPRFGAPIKKIKVPAFSL